jgi:hypothetical protein
MSEELCLFIAEHPELGELPCVWSDNTPVVTGHPVVTCPEDVSILSPYCGGSCGFVECPRRPSLLMDITTPGGSSESCLGVSDTRGYGVCAWTDERCASNLGGLLPSWFEACSYGYDGAACACMVLEPPDESGVERGSFVLGSVCAAYARDNPGVTCRGPNWELLP